MYVSVYASLVQPHFSKKSLPFKTQKIELRYRINQRSKMRMTLIYLICPPFLDAILKRFTTSNCTNKFQSNWINFVLCQFGSVQYCYSLQSQMFKISYTKEDFQVRSETTKVRERRAKRKTKPRKIKKGDVSDD